jgi:hypothetical protein
VLPRLQPQADRHRCCCRRRPGGRGGTGWADRRLAMPRSVAVSSICSKGCRRARGRPGRCAPLRGALRASLTAAARGGFRKRRSGRRDGPLIEQQDGCLDPTLSESLDTSTTARFNGETPLSARMSSLLCAPGDISILRRHEAGFARGVSSRSRSTRQLPATMRSSRARMRCRECDERGRVVVSVTWGSDGVIPALVLPLSARGTPILRHPGTNGLSGCRGRP